MQYKHNSIKGSNLEPQNFNTLGERQPGYPNLLKGYARTFHAERKSRRPDPGEGKGPEEIKGKFRFGGSKVILSVWIRQAAKACSKDPRSYDLAVMLYLIGRMGWNPGKAGFLEIKIKAKRIAKDMGITQRGIMKSLNRLRELGLIHTEVMSDGKAVRGLRITLLYLGDLEVLNAKAKHFTDAEIFGILNRIPGVNLENWSELENFQSERLPGESDFQSERLPGWFNFQSERLPVKSAPIYRRVFKKVSMATEKNYRYDLVWTERDFDNLDGSKREKIERIKRYLEDVQIAAGVCGPLDWQGQYRWIGAIMLQMTDSTLTALEQLDGVLYAGSKMYRGAIVNQLYPLYCDLAAIMENNPEQLEANKAHMQGIELAVEEASRQHIAHAAAERQRLADRNREIAHKARIQAAAAELIGGRSMDHWRDREAAELAALNAEWAAENPF